MKKKGSPDHSAAQLLEKDVLKMCVSVVYPIGIRLINQLPAF
jgi:hypothetical protein